MKTYQIILKNPLKEADDFTWTIETADYDDIRDQAFRTLIEIEDGVNLNNKIDPKLRDFVKVIALYEQDGTLKNRLEYICISDQLQINKTFKVLLKFIKHTIWT